METSYEDALAEEQKEKKLQGDHSSQRKPVPTQRRRERWSWKVWEQQVERRQKQIAQASQHGERQAVYLLQQQLMEAEAARLLAVRRVAEENQGRNTAGVDGVKSLTAEERLAMAEAIHPQHWKQQVVMPVRRVWVAKPGTTERRPLAILPMIDRCKQALVKLALEPEWETRFEAHSYGYRPGRGAHDAIAALVVALQRRSAFVFDADIAEAFDHINQAVLLSKLQTYSALREAIEGWLKAGIMEGGNYLPSETGIAQGGVLSPLLMNIALHGLETVAAGGKTGEQLVDAPLLVRYGDDFVILHADLQVLQQAIKRVKRWLATLGLALNAQKTRITHTLTPYQGQVGFDFLSFTIRQKRGDKSEQETLQANRMSSSAHRSQSIQQRGRANVKTIITPSQQATQRHLAMIEQRLQRLQSAPQAQVIEELNPLIAGWATYYNGIVEATRLGRYDELLEQRLLQWAGKRHPGKTRDWLLNRYWRQGGQQGHVFACDDGLQLRVYQPVRMLR